MKILLKNYADFLLGQIKDVFAQIDGTCHYAIVTVGDDAGSLLYVKNKQKKSENIPNVECDWIQLDTQTSQEDLCNHLERLSCDSNVHGILLQQPLPKHLNTQEALKFIAPEKDIDGLTLTNKRFLYTGDVENSLTPCTCLGIMLYMGHYFKGDIAGKTVLVIGRSDLVGRPLSQAIEESNATLIWANSHTPEDVLIKLSHQADIIICAVGKQGFIHSVHVNTAKHQLFIDVGINYTLEGQLVGDCALDVIAELGFCDVTAVPGGVGQLTTTALLYNLYKCWEWQQEN